METFEKPPEAVKKEEKKVEKKPERMLKLPEKAAKYLNRVIEISRKKIFYPPEGVDRDLNTLSGSDNPSPKYNKLLKRMLFNVLDAEVRAKEESEFLETIKLQQGEEKARGYLHKFFDEFFSPLVKKEENEKKFEEHDKEKKELVKELNKINEHPYMSKSEKKEKRAPVETRLLELFRLRKGLEEKIGSFDALLEFIPGYRRDLEEFNERPRKTVTSIRQEEEDFRKKWVEEKLDKKLEKLRKDLEGLL